MRAFEFEEFAYSLYTTIWNLEKKIYMFSF